MTDKDIGKNTVMVCITYYPESVKDLVSQQKSLLTTAGKLKDNDKPPPVWFSGADFKLIHEKLRGNYFSSSESYLTVKQESYCCTCFSCSESESKPVVIIDVHYQTGDIFFDDSDVEKRMMSDLSDHWLDKCHIRNLSKSSCQ